MLHTCNDEDDFAILLYMVRERLPPTAICPKPLRAMNFLGADVVQIIARDVDLFEDDDRAEARKNQGEVLSDTDIEVSGRNKLGVERELQAASAWLGDAAGGDLGDTAKDPAGAWDQFAANEQRTGKRSTYSEELYTTKLSDKQFTKEQLDKAERMAREIERKESSNLHVAEERGQRPLADDMDEEERYSTVLRTDDARVTVHPPKNAWQGGSGAAGLPPAEGQAELAVPFEEPVAPAPAPASEGSKFGSKLRATAAEFVPGCGGGAATKSFSPSPATPPHPVPAGAHARYAGMAGYQGGGQMQMPQLVMYQGQGQPPSPQAQSMMMAQQARPGVMMMPGPRPPMGSPPMIMQIPMGGQPNMFVAQPNMFVPPQPHMQTGMPRQPGMAQYMPRGMPPNQGGQRPGPGGFVNQMPMGPRR